MQSKYQNMYQSAREGAGLTQEQAAQLLDVSTKSIQCYEAGNTTPNPGMVGRMMHVYGATWLRNRYCNRCPLGADGSLPEQKLSVQQIAINMGLKQDIAKEYSEHVQRFFQIAYDEHISDDELEVFQEIEEYFIVLGLIGGEMRIVRAARNNVQASTHIVLHGGVRHGY